MPACKKPGYLWGLLLLVVMTGCSFTFQSDPTTTPSPLPPAHIETATFTPSPSPTITLSPTEGPAPADTPIQPSPAPDTPQPVPVEPSTTLAGTPTEEVTTVPPTNTATVPPLIPTSTPFPTVSYRNDQWLKIDVPAEISDGLERSWLIFMNYNDASRRFGDQEADANAVQTLYMVDPVTRRRVEVYDIPASTGDRVFWSPAGTHILYFMEADPESPTEDVAGLYMLDLGLGLRYRLYDIPTLNPRGIPGQAVTWSADGELLALTLPTEYATDIFVMDAEGANIQNVTNSSTYDLWPSFSPDGAWLAFVSDRMDCPTRIPGEPDTCDQPGSLPPTSGNLFVLNLETGQLQRVVEANLSGPAHWITSTKLAFSTGGGNPLATQSELWLVDIETGSATQVSPDEGLSIGESWSPDAQLAVYQQAAATTSIVLADTAGRTIAETDEFVFPRYGMVADWAPDGDYLAIGGHGGQCPYGILVTDPALEVVTAPSETLLACDPAYSPDGEFLAFTGIQPSRLSDGRFDIYITNPNGIGARSLTTDLRGQTRLLGWIGP